MKKLFEEFKEYENLWEDTSTEDASTEEPAEEPEDEEEDFDVKAEAQKIRDELGLDDSYEKSLAWYKEHNRGVDIEYDAYTVDGWEDHWDPYYETHYTVDKSEEHDAFTYKIDIEEAVEYVWDDIIWNEERYLIPAYLDKVVKKRQKNLFDKSFAPEIEAGAKKFLAEYQKVKDFYDEWDDEDLLLTFIADNISDFAYYYEELFSEYFYDRAHDF